VGPAIPIKRDLEGGGGGKIQKTFAVVKWEEKNTGENSPEIGMQHSRKGEGKVWVKEEENHMLCDQRYD